MSRRKRTCICLLVVAVGIFQLRVLVGLFDYWESEKLLRYPPRSFPWHKWDEERSNSSSVGETSSVVGGGMSFQPVLEALVAWDASPPEDFSYDLLLLRNGILFHSNTKMKACKEPACTRFALMEQGIQASLNRFRKHKQLQPRVLPLYEDELVFFIRLDDRPDCHVARVGQVNIDKFPSFGWCQHVSCRYSWPIVSYSMFEDYAPKRITPHRWRARMQRWQRRYPPWKSKINKALWRGSCTGPAETWRTDNQRVKLVRYGRNHTETMDFAFTGGNQIPKEDMAEWLDEFQIVDPIEREDQQQYKAIVDVDGNAWSSRFSWQLCMNSVTIKVEPTWVEYFYGELEPWVHFVPVHANLSNLAHVVDYVLSHDEEMRRIVQNANKWCERRLVSRQVSLDMLWLLVAFTEALNRFDPEWRETWRSNVTAYTLRNLGMVPV